MTQRIRRAIAAVLVIGMLSSSRAHAQVYDYLVYDDSNFIEAVLQVLNIIRQYSFMIQQARRLPVDMLNRYRALSPAWPLHDLNSWLYAQPVLSALNVGDASGSRYRQVADLLDVPSDVLARIPAELRRRLGSAYATIEFADSIAARGVDQAGTVRANGKLILQTIQAMDTDATALDDSYHSQVAVLNKINTASVLGLRIGAQSNQFLMDTLEQLLVDNKRKRDTEAKAMNATIHQWRYGAAYGADLFRSTAANLDSYRPY